MNLTQTQLLLKLMENWIEEQKETNPPMDKVMDWFYSKDLG